MKFNRWFVLALACLVLLCMPVVRAEAAGDWQYHGSCGSDATWKLEDGVLTISGTGAINNYTSTPWYPVQDEVLAVVVEPGITRIGSGAFGGCTNLEEVTIPSTVTQICNYAFQSCSNISRVNITDLAAWCQTIFGYDFDYHVDYLTANPLHSGAALYLNGELVTDLVIPAGVERVKPYAFAGCSSITSLEVGADVKQIAKHVFYNCDNLETVKILNGVETVGGYSLADCENLTVVEIGASVNHIVGDTFASSTNLSEVHITDLAAWCNINFSFYANENYTGEFDAEANPLCYGAALYLNGEQVTELVIPESVASITECAFYNASGIETVVIPVSVTKIGDGAFYGCVDLTTVFVQSMSIVQDLESSEACGNLIANAETLGVIYPYVSIPAYIVESFPYSKQVDKNGVSYMLFSIWDTNEEDCNHDYYVSGTYDPTCEYEGYTEYTCANCGDCYEDDYVPALEHDYEITSVEATCTAWGYTRYNCLNCGEWYEEEIAPYGHNFVDGVCVNCGRGEGIRIVLSWGAEPSDLDSHLIYSGTNGSGEIFYGDMELYGSDGELIAALDVDDTSSYGPETITIYTVAEGEYFRYYVHDYSNGSNAASTALANSGAVVEVYQGETLLASFTVPTDIHGYIWEVFSFGDGNIEELEHEYTSVTVDPTCTESGYTEYTCTGCGDNYRVYTDPLGHDYVEVSYTAPTCTESGYAEHSCIRCGDSYSAEIAPLDHNFEDGTCTNCGRGEGIRIVLTWGAEPSDLDSHLIYSGTNGSGEIFYGDKTLYDNEGRPIADLDVDDTSSYGPETITIYTVSEGEYFRYYVHDYTNRSDGASSALANSGAHVEVYRGDELLASFDVPTDIRGYIWEVFSYGDGDIEELEHEYTSVTVAPTCTEQGYIEYTCISCSDSYRIYNAEPLDHDYAFAYREDGYEYYTCTRCGDTYVIESMPTLIVGKVSGMAGETVEVILTLENAPALRALGIINITYDTENLTLIGGEWLLQDALMTDWDADNQIGAAAYLENTDVNGQIFKLTFRINENAQPGDYAIGCTLTAKEKPEGGAETVVSVETVSGAVSVVTYLRGDVNDDGVVDADDAVHLLMYVLFGEEYYPINQPCDFDGNGEVDTDDAIYLLYHTLFGESTYPLN